MEDSIRRLALAELDPDRLRRLVGEGEPLFVERKEATPKEGLGPTVASFANTLGGWLLLGVADDGGLRGWREHGRSDLQDHLRHVLRREVDPLPPFSARSIELEDQPIGVVRVIESVDTPHIARRTGALYIREPGGKRPISDTARSSSWRAAARRPSSVLSTGTRQWVSWTAPWRHRPTCPRTRSVRPRALCPWPWSGSSGRLH